MSPVSALSTALMGVTTPWSLKGLVVVRLITGQFPFLLHVCSRFGILPATIIVLVMLVRARD